MLTRGQTRAILIDTLDRGAGAPKRYRFRASSTGRARGDAYLLPAEGWDLTTYRDYPVILAFHDVRSFPIGIATALDIDAEGLVDEVEFDDGDPLGVDVMRKLDRGIPVAQSVSFDVLEAERPRSDGLIPATRQSLLEISMVGLPSDPKALPLRELDMDLDALAERVAQRIAALSPTTPDPEPARPASEPSLLDLLASVRAHPRLAAGSGDGLTPAERLAIDQLYTSTRQPQLNPRLLAQLEKVLV